MDDDPDKWFEDRISKDFIQLHRVEEVVYSGQTKFQSIEIIRTGSFGKCLVLDSKIQSSDFDEFIYHETLVQPAMLAHPNPERVFIAGGGEGATLRELLSHKTVKKAVMIDIDEDVINVCRKYLPEYSRGAFEDERTELRHTDARQYLADCGEAFDVIIIDLTEPVEEGPAYLLYTEEFYKLVSERLTENGIISVQSGSASPNELFCFSAVYSTLKKVFPVVRPFQIDIPSFGGPWGFCLASLAPDPLELSTEEIDAAISEKKLDLKCYDGETHLSMFSVPKHLRATLESQTTVIKDDKPLYIYDSR